MRARAIPLALLLLLLPICLSRAADLHIDFTEETLDNGLHVIYAPLHQSPVVHVRIHYHVGSRDERPDRQGFAHMFEHMMFRGSAHVKSEEHMDMITRVGGFSYAFTDYDQTVYEESVPANQLELALYLEADRMASFKVSEEIFDIERKVVCEELRRHENQPNGTDYDEFFKLAFTTHSYRWSRIGQISHLQAAKAWELQEFFKTYYIPNNALLVIAGDIDLPAAKAMVRKYFDWIPRGGAIRRMTPAEPPQSQPRHGEVFGNVPLTSVFIGWHTPPSRSDDQYALDLLARVLGDGRFGRLNRLLRGGRDSLAYDVDALNYSLEDAGVFTVVASVLNGIDSIRAEKLLAVAVGNIRDNGITNDELTRARFAHRLSIIDRAGTARGIAARLGDTTVFGGDASRVNWVLKKIDAIDTAKIQAVARLYLPPEGATSLHIKPASKDRAAPAATQAALAAEDAPKPLQAALAVKFPDGYPQRPPIAPPQLQLRMATGTQSTIAGVTVIVIPDDRLPAVIWQLALRSGTHHDPIGKEGLAQVTAEFVRYCAGDEDLESRGISLEIKPYAEWTHLSGHCLTDQTDYAMERSREILRDPKLIEDRLEGYKNLMIGELTYDRSHPHKLAKETLIQALYGDSILGRIATPASISSITFSDVLTAHQRLARPNDAVLIISGDVSVERGQQLAEKFLRNWETRAAPKLDYSLPARPKRRIILIDRPQAREATIDMGVRAFDIRSDETFSGALAGSILSQSIGSRLNRYLRAERGLIYAASGLFDAKPHAGEFIVSTETDPSTTAATIEGIIKILGDMGRDGVSDVELRGARLALMGNLVIDAQTIPRQAAYRMQTIINGLPADFYSGYAQRLSEVGAEQVRQVMAKYVRPEEMIIVVVGPGVALKSQLERFGTVEVQPMP